MPELPEVETIARQLRPQILERRLDAVEVLWERTVERPTAAEFVRALRGASVIALGRRGKFLSFGLDTGKTWLVHLRMTGKFRIHEAANPLEEEPHLRARFRLDNGVQVNFIDQRKFGRFYLVEDPATITSALGPEPLGPDFSAGWFSAALARRRGEIKRLLLDQHFIAGLGNIYVSEALWRAGIHPLRPANNVTEEEAVRLHAAIVAVLTEGVENGGTSLADRQYVYPNGGLGEQQRYLAVYDRDGGQCPRCHYTLERIVQAQRSTFFCPVCQPLPESGDSVNAPQHPPYNDTDSPPISQP